MRDDGFQTSATGIQSPTHLKKLIDDLLDAKDAEIARLQRELFDAKETIHRFSTMGKDSGSWWSKHVAAGGGK